MKLGNATLVARVVAALPDLSLLLAAVLVSAHALALPYGHDQGLYHYVAREWVLHGAIPYRDVFDHKTPGIYLVYGAAIRLFGSHMSSIRLLEIPCVLGLGAVCARMVVPRGTSIPRGLVGIGALGAAWFHYGFFNYWDTAQSEVWFVTFGLASCAAALQCSTLRRAEIVAGFTGGVALLLKPPSIWFVLLAMAIVARRARREAPDRPLAPVRSAFVYGALAASVQIVVLLYFAAHGALGAMFDIVVKANGYYVAHESGVRSAAELWAIATVFFDAFFPVSALLPVGVLAMLFVARRRRDAERADTYALVAASALAALAALVMQKKFYSMHFVVMVGPATLATTALAADFLRTAKMRDGLRIATFSAALALAAIATPAARHGWLWENSVVLDHATGKLTDDQYAGAFVIDDRFYSFRDVRRTGLWLRDHTRPDEHVAVRGFNSEVYAVADRHYAGRFFWTPFLTYPSRLYRREDYLREDQAVFDQNPPRYVVAMSDVHVGLDSAEWYEARGYDVAADMGKLTILERAADARP